MHYCQFDTPFCTDFNLAKLSITYFDKNWLLRKKEKMLVVLWKRAKLWR